MNDNIDNTIFEIYHNGFNYKIYKDGSVEIYVDNRFDNSSLVIINKLYNLKVMINEQW